MKIEIKTLKMPGADGQAGGGGNTYGIGPQAIIGAASGAIGMGVQRLGVGYDYRKQREQQQRLNYQQIEFNDRMSRMQQQYALEMWENTGYGAQKDQMKRAGLNPALMYGMSGGGGQTAQAGMGGAAPSAQDPNTRGATGTMMGMGLQSAAQLALLQAQKENIEADTANKKADIPVKDQTEKNLGADTKNKIADEERKGLDNALIALINSTTPDGKNIETGEEMVGAKSIAFEQLKQKTEEMRQSIKLMKAQGDTQEKMKEKISNEIKLLQSEIDWNALEVEQSNLGKFITNLIKLLVK